MTVDVNPLSSRGLWSILNMVINLDHEFFFVLRKFYRVLISELNKTPLDKLGG